MRHKQVSISLFALLVLLSIGILPTAIAAENEVVVQTEEELLVAIANRTAVIMIDGFIALNQAIVIEHHVTLHGQGTLTVSDWHRHFQVVENGHLVLDGDITLTRAADYDGHGGALLVSGGIFTLRSGQIYGNRLTRGGGILLDYGRVYLYGGSISHNHATLGGGVYIGSSVGNERVFTMRGGLIAENTAEFSGGGIFSYMSTVHLERGIIRDNHAAGHGGVYLSTSTSHQIGARMQIEENSPSNRHDATELSGFERLQTLTVIHLLILFSIAVIGIIFTKRQNNRKRAIPSEIREQNKDI